MYSQEAAEETIAAARIAIPASLGDAARLFASAPQRLSTAIAEAVAAECYGVRGRATALSSERDCNFVIDTDADRLLLKFAHPDEELSAVEIQTAALLHIAKTDPELPVPRLRPSKSGALFVQFKAPAGRPVIVRLLTFLPGRPLQSVSRASPYCRNVGATLARLDRALEGLSHTSNASPLLWDISHAGRLRVLLPHLAEAGLQRLAAQFLDNFVTHAQPILPALRVQMLHNDFNPHNLLVDPDNAERLSGIIDFGDMVRAPLINDVAVAAAYQIPSHGFPLADVAELLHAYHAVNPLSEEELGVLFDLIAARQVTTLLITAWRAALYPDYSQYILRNFANSAIGLTRLATLSRAEAHACLRGVCR